MVGTRSRSAIGTSGEEAGGSSSTPMRDDRDAGEARPRRPRAADSDEENLLRERSLCASSRCSASAVQSRIQTLESQVTALSTLLAEATRKRSRRGSSSSGGRAEEIKITDILKFKRDMIYAQH